jgi:NADH dehydrogenase
MDLGVYETSYLAQSHWHFFRYRVGEMIGLDRKQRTVAVAPFVDEDGDIVTPKRQFSYDTLAVAVGSRTNDFGTPGAKEHAISLDAPEDAERFHRRLVNAYIRAHVATIVISKWERELDHAKMERGLRRDEEELEEEARLKHAAAKAAEKPA